MLDRVFETLFTTRPQEKGSGLGLSQFWSFVRQSGSLERIESGPGQGTAVRLFLPLHRRVAAAVADAQPYPDPSTDVRGTVLLVDDEDGVRAAAADLLRGLGLAVLEARDGQNALRVLKGTRPDMLVTDVELPGGMNGRQVAEAARELVTRLSVLFITGCAGAALPPGMEVIGKPFALDTLARRVTTVLEAGRRNLDGI